MTSIIKMIGVEHIHYGSLQRHARTIFDSLFDVDITGATGDLNSFIITKHNSSTTVNVWTNPEVFDHKVVIDKLHQPWFSRAGAGKDSRAYAIDHDHFCMISAEVETKGGSFRKFTSFTDNNAFLEYAKMSKEKHLYECIRPDTPCMMFTDHDQQGGVNDLRSHQEGVFEFIEFLCKSLGLPPQKPQILNSHRTKENGDYLSTHLRFTDVSLENCNETLKLLHHLVKHTIRRFGGLDMGTHSCYQQLRVPGYSKAHSTTRLLPADGSELNGIHLVGNSCIRPFHITTAMVSSALKKMFGCIDSCNLKHTGIEIPTAEIEHITNQIKVMYTEKTGHTADSISYTNGTLWTLSHKLTCIHSENHKTNNMYIYLKGSDVFCQCHGRCKTTREPVKLGTIFGTLSIRYKPWNFTPNSCFIAIRAIDVVSRLKVGIDLKQLSLVLACIGDFKDLLSKYAGFDVHTLWDETVQILTLEKRIPSPMESIESLEEFIGVERKTKKTDDQTAVKNKKRKRKTGVDPIKFNYVFDFERYQREHPHPMTIDPNIVNHQQVHSRYLEFAELDLSRRVILLHSEMCTGKTSNVIVKMLDALPTDAIVYILTPKRLFAESIHGVLDKANHPFSHYKDTDFFKNRPNKMIIEIESLWKLKHYNFKPADFLLVDESETTLTQHLSVATHKHNLRNNWNVLVWLLEHASKVLFADARMSMISLGFVQDHCITSDVHYIKNTFKNSMQVNYFLSKPLMDRYLKESIGRNESLYTFSGSKNNAYRLHDLAQKAFGDGQSVVYSSSNSHLKQVKDELRNVNESWISKKSINTTPSLTVGTSFDVPGIIQNIYLYPYTMTAGRKDVTQSAARVRVPITKEINCCVSGPSKIVPTSYSSIKKLLFAKADLALISESVRIEKDFEDDTVRLNLLRHLVSDPGERSSIVATGIRVTQERNLQLLNYNEQLMYTFLEIGHTVTLFRTDDSIDRDDDAKDDVPMPLEQQVFVTYEGTAGIMAHYDDEEESLLEKERNETLTESDHALLKMVNYIKNFNPAKWPLLSYEYWMDYKYKLNKDKRLQMLIISNADDVEDRLDRNNRYNIAKAEGDLAMDRVSILHSATVPEFNRVEFYAFGKPLFRLFELIGLSDMVTTSRIIKTHTVEVNGLLQECRVLLGPEGWRGKELSVDSTYKELIGFLTLMMDALIDGTLILDSIRKVATTDSITVNHNETKSGKTTRKAQEHVMTYKLNFIPPEKTHGVSYSAVERIEHLNTYE